jgi:hypothetical protein
MSIAKAVQSPNFATAEDTTVPEKLYFKRYDVYFPVYFFVFTQI